MTDLIEYLRWLYSDFPNRWDALVFLVVLGVFTVVVDELRTDMEEV